MDIGTNRARNQTAKNACPGEEIFDAGCQGFAVEPRMKPRRFVNRRWTTDLDNNKINHGPS